VGRIRHGAVRPFAIYGIAVWRDATNELAASIFKGDQFLIGKSVFLLSAVLGLALPACADTNYDLIVYGGTAAGAMTAVSGAREGLHVLLLEPGTHIGGMATGGLSRTDYGRKGVIGGYALEFYWRVSLKYGLDRFAEDVAWFYEPRIGEKVLTEMLDEAHVTVLYRHRLRERTGVSKQGSRVESVTTEDGTTYRAAQFADCSYEGDLMAQAGVQYTWGRESSAQYGESLAGVRARTPFHQFKVKIPARDTNGRLLPEISAEPLLAPGTADKKVQAYNFRMVLTDDPDNRLPFAKPAGYDPRRYALFAQLLAEETKRVGRPLNLRDVTLPVPIPNHKADFNNHGAFSTDFLGASWDYPDGSYARRAEIWQAHVDYTKGFFYFLTHDASVPPALQREANQWGLSKDEFLDTDHWPHQLYIREARRMVGDFVMAQKDLQTDLTKPDVIGMGSYNSDSHNVQRIVNADGNVENEGDMQVAVKPYQIPYRVVLPRRGEVTNLTVPVCFSASHVAYSSLRMEPQYMILGQAAGVAASLALKSGRSVQDIAVDELQAKLKSQGAVLEWSPAADGPARSLNQVMRLLHRPEIGH
jgi:hypothetical protein